MSGIYPQMLGVHRHIPRPLWWLAVALLVLAAGGWGYLTSRRSHQEGLSGDALRCVRILLAGERRAEESASAVQTYARLPERLQELQVVRPNVLALAVVRVAEDKQETLASVQAVQHPRSARTRPTATLRTLPSALVRRVERQKWTCEGPLEDAEGSFAIGYALIASNNGEEGASDIFVLVVSADEWRAEMLWSAAGWALAGLALFGLPALAYLWMRRDSTQESRIHALSEAVEQSRSAIMIVNTEGRIEYVNLGMCLQMGFNRDEMVGHRWHEFVTAPVPSGLISEMVKTIRAGKSWEGEWVHQRKNGQRYTALGVVSPVFGSGKSVIGCIAVISDQTDQQRVRKELREAKEVAEASDKAKGRFLATMSHEVRTPLNGIVGFASLLLETPLTPDQREYVQTIRNSVEALVHLSGDILDFSKIESGGLQLEPAPCDLRACVEDALDLFSSKAAEKRIELLHWIEADVPAQALLDGGRLRQVLINLVGNAIKFTPSGEVEVRVRVLTGKAASMAPFDLSHLNTGQMIAELDDGSLTVEFSVRDTGIGISEGDMPKLFQPFSQLDSGSVRRYGGAGLGLVISRNLVQLMGGQIWLESECGRGSTFSFTVRGRPSTERSLGPAPGCLAGRKIAVAAFSPSLRVELTRLIEVMGGQPRMCAPDDLDFLGDDLILLDTALLPPESAGEFLVKRVRGWRTEIAFGLAPIALGAAQRKALRPHFRIMLNKPVHHMTLVDLLVRTAQQTGSARGTTPARGTRDLQILVVEDNEVNQRMLCQVLDHLGCRWQISAHGRDCLQRLKRETYDVVFMDIHMPEMDGLTATRQIRSGESGETAKTHWIVAVTADDRDGLREMAASSGADDFLHKPITLVEIETALLRYLEARRRRNQASAEDVISQTAL